jgi:hypothetical protein
MHGRMDGWNKETFYMFFFYDLGEGRGATKRKEREKMHRVEQKNWTILLQTYANIIRHGGRELCN